MPLYRSHQTWRMAAMIETTSALSRGAPSTTSVDGRPAIELRGITKRFPGVVANDDITLDIFAGEIHVLLGENGAGKSTLISILAGLQQPDAGTISVNGRPVRIDSPRRKPRPRYRHRFSARAAGAEPYGAGKSHARRFVVASRCIGGRRSNVSANYPTFSASRSTRTRRSDGLRLANNSRSRSCMRFGEARACSFSTSRPRC